VALVLRKDGRSQLVKACLRRPCQEILPGVVQKGPDGTNALIMRDCKY
jgi:hypothetical protein